MTAAEEYKVYLKPTGFLKSPQQHDRKSRRLHNGLLWFSQIEYQERDATGVVRRALVGVEDAEGFIAQLDNIFSQRATRLWGNLLKNHDTIACGERTIRFDQPQVMGIVNMTPDSFSDGGRFTDAPEQAAQAGFDQAAAGATIIDVGGESTRPGAARVWEGDEIARVVPVIERLSAGGALVSVDTRKAAVMKAAIDAGAAIVNDVSALLHDPLALAVVLKAGVPVIVMHAPSAGDDPHKGANYRDAATDVFDWLDRRITALVEAGLARGKIIVDPGLGFGKSLGDNLAILNDLAMFHTLGAPVLVGASRKRMIGALSNEAPADRRLGGSLALAMHALDRGAHIVRAHDVPETVQAVQVWRGLRDAGLTAPAA